MPGIGAGTGRRLARWYGSHGRHHLPWRRERDRYGILVSEVMLQQTQVARVVPYWLDWMERWPGVPALARASRAEVIRAWSGLGYNSRAVRLHEAAALCGERHAGRIPGTMPGLLALPGVGSYTARAVLCFSDGRRLLPLDTNIARVIARAWHGVARPADVPPGAMRQTAESLAPPRNSRDRALALMDLGATVCTSRAPACDECPLQDGCAWHASGRPSSQPEPETAPLRFEESARWARGRIVEHLRHGPQPAERLESLLPGRHRERFEQYISALARDGLVERAGAMVALPGDLQSMNMASPKL